MPPLKDVLRKGLLDGHAPVLVERAAAEYLKRWKETAYAIT